MDPHAQHEVKVYADEMGKIADAVAPSAYEAFNDYVLNAFHITGPEANVLRRLLSEKDLSRLEELSQDMPTQREGVEFLDKMKRMISDSQ